MHYRGTFHKATFEKLIMDNPYRCSGRYMAAVYLLSVDRVLWNKSKRAINKKEIHFSLIDRYDLTTYDYTYLKLAEDIFLGTEHLSICDLMDEYLITASMFEIIMTAIALGRGGYTTAGLEKKFN